MNNYVWNIDNLIFMCSLPDKYYDLAIVDPPYGIGEDGSKNKSRGKTRGKNKAIAKDYKGYIGGDKEPPSQEYFTELFRISKNQIIFGANHFIERINKNSSCWIVWDKLNEGTDFADCELAWTSFKSTVRKVSFMWNGMQQGLGIGKLQQKGKQSDKEFRIHPNQKPVELYKWILLKYAKEGDKIFDSHVGSGSLRIACYDLGFDFVGCELDCDYWLAQDERYRNHIKQIKLF